MDFTMTEGFPHGPSWACEFGERTSPGKCIRKLDVLSELPEDLYKKVGQTVSMAIAAPKECGGSGDILIVQAIVCKELARAMRIDAERKDGGWVVNGQKLATYGAHVAYSIRLLNRTAPEEDGNKHNDDSAPLKPGDDPGLFIGWTRTLAPRTIDSFTLFYDYAFVPNENVLDEPSQGWGVLTHTLNNARSISAAMCLGIAQVAFEDTLTYAGERDVFDRPIRQFESIAKFVVCMQVRIEQARLPTRPRECTRRGCLMARSPAWRSSWRPGPSPRSPMAVSRYPVYAAPRRSATSRATGATRTTCASGRSATRCDGTASPRRWGCPSRIDVAA